MAIRNLLGGFLGGMVGFVLCAWSPVTLPFGVLIGCIIGFYHREVPQVVLGSLASTTRFGTVLLGGIQTTHCVICLLLKECGRELHQHPMNQAEVIRVTVYVLHFLLVVLGPLVLVIATLFGGPEREIVMGSSWQTKILGYGLPFAYMIWAFVCLMIMQFRWQYADSNPPSILAKMSDFYHRWELYSISPFLYALHEAWSLLKLDLKILGFLTGLVLWFVLNATITLLASVIFAALLQPPILLLRGITELVTRTEHWLCVGVTLTVTIATAWLFQPASLSVQMLWLLAFLTGIVSGAGTEVIRRLLARYVVPLSGYQYLISLSMDTVWKSLWVKFPFPLETVLSL